MIDDSPSRTEDPTAKNTRRGFSDRTPQFVKFVAVSGVAAATNFGSRMLFSLAMPYPAAIMLAYCVGMSIAFFLNRRLVFVDSTNTLRKQMALFAIVNLFGLAQTLIVSLVFAHWVLPWLGITAHVEEIAHAVGIAVPTISSYLGHKYFSFHKR